MEMKLYIYIYIYIIYIYIRGGTVHVFVSNRHGTGISVRCMRPYDEYRQFTPNPEGGARSNAMLLDNRQQQCCQIGRVPGGFEFDCAGKYWLGRVDKIWAGFWSVWRFSKHKIV